MLRPPADVLEYELAGEGAASLGIAGEKLERALGALRRFDEALAATAAAAPVARAELVAEAAERLWIYIIQRECLGVYHHDRVLELMGVPREVRARMGPKPRVR